MASQDPWIELRALAKSLGREPDALAATVSDAKSYLDGDGADVMARSRRELLVEDLPEQQPGVVFDAGAPSLDMRVEMFFCARECTKIMQAHLHRFLCFF
ncbi:MAG: hypothetical protein Q7T65_10285 [Thiobacillus sp.]|nr:hypothetical protein [Thiobacillus sp.]